MDFWDGWKLSYLTQAFSNQPASLTGMELGKEMASGKTPYSSSYRSASFTEQTLVWEACTPPPLLIFRWRSAIAQNRDFIHHQTFTLRVPCCAQWHSARS
jgi:hypothetical protein